MPLLWISLSFIAGLVLEYWLSWSGFAWLVFAVACLALWPIARRVPPRGVLLARLGWLGQAAQPPVSVPPLVLLAVCFLGAARLALSGPDLAGGHIAAENDQGQVRIQAIVVAPPDRRDSSTQLRLEVEEVTPLDDDGAPGEPRAAHGLVLALLPGGSGYQYGDRLELEGRLETPPENEEFSYRDYLARQDVYSYLGYPRTHLLEHGAGNPLMAAIVRFRDWAYEEVYHLFPAPEAPLLAGILLGMDNAMPEALSQAFRDTGTAHVIAISGFNIAILAGLFSTLFGRVFSRWWALLASVLAISVYTVMVGATPSVVRAAIMGSLSLLAHQIGRKSAGLNILFATGGAMCLQNPHMPWDASFQLSFGATAGLILYGERFQHGFTALLRRRLPAQTARRISDPISEYVLLTLAAQLMTLPIILTQFQRLSIVSLLANPLILPVQPLVMVLSGLAVLAGLVSDPLAHLLAWLAWPLSAYTNRMVALLAGIPGGVVVFGEIGLGTAALLYALVLAPLLKDRWPGRLKAALRPAAPLAASALLAATLLRAAASVPDGRLHLTVFNMQGSQVLLIQAPTGERLLVNSGPSARLLDDALGRRFSPFDQRLDAVLINSEQASAMTSLASVTERFPAGAVYWGCDPPGHRTAQRLEETLLRGQVFTHQLSPGETLRLGPEVRLEVLAADETGSALLLRWKDFRALVPGGLKPGALAGTRRPNLLVLDARALKEAPPEDWQALEAQAVIAPADSLTRLPAPPLPAPPNWLLNAPQGWYAVSTDGARMWIEAQD